MSLSPETFEPPEAGLVEDMFARAWDIIADQQPVEVVLRFAPKVAARVQEARWHPSQRVTVEADGSLLWRATIAGTIEVRLWALQWGDDVEVIAPVSLRDDVVATHRRALERHDAGSDATNSGETSA
jgi:predicted DNA-binding transcriptional regulator YafY